MRVVVFEAVHEPPIEEGRRRGVSRQAGPQDVRGPIAAEGRCGVEIRSADTGARGGQRDANGIEQMQATTREYVCGNVGKSDGADLARKQARQGHGFPPLTSAAAATPA